jgi:cytochrome c-type biogenesis protein CcmF
MIAELGHFAIVLALAVSIVQGTLPLVGAQRGIESLSAIARPAAIMQFALLALAFVALTMAFTGSDFSVLNVWQNSHTDKPLLYKISGVWGNHEGSLLLWVLILAAFGFGVATLGNNLPPSLRTRVIAIQGLIGVGFLLLLVFLSNPFERVFPVPVQGNGLNPLLQDPGLAFHPPFLYVGYVGFSIAFSFAVAALIEGKVDAAWARWVRPWTLAAWVALTIGIAMGSWWAYYELGWGGWWFWDPVENASFMPWLLGTALLHSAIVVEKRNTLKSWTVLLAILTFSFSLLGTFIVRSGVLNSVHSFATDPERGVYILAFLVVSIGGSLGLYAGRAPALKGGGVFAPVSREGSLVLNNLLLIAATATVFIGTMYPLFLDAITGEKVTVGPPFFNATFVPLMVPLLAVMAIGPMMPWKRADLAGTLGRMKMAGAITVIVALVTLYLSGFDPILAVLGMAIGTWLVAGALVDIGERTRVFRIPLADTLRRGRNLPRSAWGGAIAHAGMGVAILGMTGTLSWEIEKLQIMRPGERIGIAGYELEFTGVKPVAGPNYDAARGTFNVYRNDELVEVMQPESRRFSDPPMVTTEAAIRPRNFGDLYAVVGESNGDGGFATRIYHKPMINWLWIGSLMMAVGGLVSLTDRRLRVGAPRRRATPAKTELRPQQQAI